MGPWEEVTEVVEARIGRDAFSLASGPLYLETQNLLQQLNRPRVTNVILPNKSKYKTF